MKYKDSGHNIILQSIFRATLIAMIVADLAEVIAAGIDGMLTGRYLGANSMAAFGIAKPFYSITGILSAVLSSGAMTVSSHWIGSGDVYKTRQIFSLTCFLGVILSVTAAAPE
jgi:Na+-driven multidrug efflux pump